MNYYGSEGPTCPSVNFCKCCARDSNGNSDRQTGNARWVRRLSRHCRLRPRRPTCMAVCRLLLEWMARPGAQIKKGIIVDHPSLYIIVRRFTTVQSPTL